MQQVTLRIADKMAEKIIFLSKAPAGVQPDLEALALSFELVFSR